MKKIQHAEQLAKEIEGSSMLSGNIHMEEERGKVMEGDYDEEDLYSGVLGKTEQAQKKNEDGLTENKDATKAPNETLSPATVVTQAKDVAINKDNSESTPPAALATPERSMSKKEDSPTTKVAFGTKSKLNPNAKSFSFNPSAKEFTPSFTVPKQEQHQVYPRPQQMKPTASRRSRCCSREIT